MSALVGFADRYVDRATTIHRADARVKLPATLLYIFAISLTGEGAWGVLALLAVPIALVAAGARIGPWLLVRRSLLALPFVAAAIPLMFTRPGEVVLEVPVLGWDASREGTVAVTTILARAWLSVLAAILLTATTPVVEMLRALRVLGLPRLLVATVFFTYRYFFVIGEEALRLMRARDSRSAAVADRRAGGTVWWRATILGHMVGSLFARSLDRSERVFAAMQARGFTGELRFLSTPAIRRVDAAGAAILVAYGFAVALGGRLA
ncbi:MAG: cobalt ECF transporter T component CbiQ [Chloroflexi bacterium]|nr:cobalt ECF transporter T component CbiQ [Chloroflexota bacterium]